MARKSRTQPKQSPDTLNVLSKVYKTAIYVRLSAEKDETRDRKTLINQRNLIKNFVDQQMDMEIHDIYMDDEISGTTFDRPEFERMMSDMRAGRINCIVVKDLSRLGRDYIETGNLVERVFPMMNIRFVAITDNYDSSKKDADLMVAVTNIANDLYAKDISKKISSSKQEAMEKGIPVGRVTYGYKVVLDENKVRVMVEDKEAADVVRWIFNEAEKGTLHSVIAAELNAKHILTPAQYKVSDEMFDEVNKMLRVEARGIEKSTKKRKKNLFICPYCGRKLMNSSAVCTPKLLCPKRRMVRTGECQQIFMLKSEAQDKVLEITKEICRTLIQEEELKKASKDKRKVTSDEYLISELKAEYDRISNSTVSCYQSYREGKYTKEEYVQLRKTNQELLADLENQISDLQEKVANQEPDAEEKIEQLTQYSMLEQYDGDVLSNIIDKVLIYNDKDIEVVFKGENFIRNAV